MGCPLYQIDAFTSRPFSGNPAAVCLPDGEREDGWLQAVAAEMNLSETAFLWPTTEGFRLRWFTPKVEVDLCGHATLAAAVALWHGGLAPCDEPIQFATNSGKLVASGSAADVRLDFPALESAPADFSAELVAALGERPLEVRQSRFDYLVIYASEADVRGLSPDFAALAATKARGIIVSAPADDPALDFVSRYFAPQAGINEDPVTGSAHCVLAPYWQERLGKHDLRGYQASSRGGNVSCQVVGDRVILGGGGVVVLAGELCC